MIRRALVLALVLAFWAPPSGAQAPSGNGPAASSEPANDGRLSPEDERRAAAIARQTMSPFCPGRTLADCPSGYATEWRADIRDMVAEGKSSEEIQKTLEARAGGNLSGSPNRDASYGLSIFFALLALGVLLAVFSRLRSSARSADSLPGAAPTDAAGSKGGSPAKKGKTNSPTKNRPVADPPAMVDEARLDAELRAEDEGPID